MILLAGLFAGSAIAQTGPTLPRFIMSKPPPAFETLAIEFGLRSAIELSIDATGRVTDVRILKSSGSEDFDTKTQKYYLKWRLQPAIDENGVPIAAKMRMVHTARGGNPDDEGRAALKRTPVDVPGNEPPPPPVDPRVHDERGRVRRMRCKDYVWEIDLLSQVAGKNKSLAYELMTQTSLVEAAADLDVRPGSEDFEKLKRNLARTIRKTADTCRGRPDDAFISQVLVAEIKAQLGR